MLGVGGGLALFSPITDADPISHFNTGAAVIWSVCAIISLFFGGLLAGRFSQSWHGGFVHGILVWSLTLIIAVVALIGGAGMILGGGLKILGEGMGGLGKAAVPFVANAAQDGAKRTTDVIGSFTDEATQSIPTNSAPKASIRAKREVGFAIAKLFAPENDLNSQDNRAAAIKALQDYTQMSQADATSTVDEWIASYRNLQAELNKAKAAAEQKAKEAADVAARNLACVATWSFFALLVGLAVSVLGGACGARCAARHYSAVVVEKRP
jgi:hypothetical protein